MNTKFYNLLSTVLAILILAIIGLGVILHFRLPHLTSDIYLELGTLKFADFQNQRIYLPFDRPMNKESVSAAVLIKDTVGESQQFNIVWNYDTAIVSFTQPLKSNSNYYLSLSNSATDIYTIALDKDYMFEFKTAPQLLTYLNRANPGSNSEEKVVLHNLDLNSFTTLFTAQGISSYKIAGNYMAVLLQDLNFNQQLKILKLDYESAVNQTVAEYELANAKVVDYSINSKGELVFINQPQKVVNNFPIPEGSSELKLLNSNLSLDLTQALTNAMNVTWLPDNSGLILKVATFDDTLGASSEYVLTSFPNVNTSSILGKFPALNQINANADRILFTSLPRSNLFAGFPEIYLLNANKELEQISNGLTDNVIDPIFTLNPKVFLLAKQVKELERTRGVYSISEYDSTNKQYKTIALSDTKSLELPRLSGNGKYIAAEAYSPEQLVDFKNLRSYGFQTKPFIGDLTLIYYTTGSLITTFTNAIEAYWIN